MLLRTSPEVLSSFEGRLPRDIAGCIAIHFEANCYFFWLVIWKVVARKSVRNRTACGGHSSTELPTWNPANPAIGLNSWSQCWRHPPGSSTYLPGIAVRFDLWRPRSLESHLDLRPCRMELNLVSPQQHSANELLATRRQKRRPHPCNWNRNSNRGNWRASCTLRNWAKPSLLLMLGFPFNLVGT